MLHIHEPCSKCPVCSSPIYATEGVFRRYFSCKRCHSALRVSPTYLRNLFLLCYGIALALLWASGKRDMLRLSLYFLPTAFLVLMFVVRIAPFVVGPTMLAGDPPSHFITLNLHSPLLRDQLNASEPVGPAWGRESLRFVRLGLAGLYWPTTWASWCSLLVRYEGNGSHRGPLRYRCPDYPPNLTPSSSRSRRK